MTTNERPRPLMQAEPDALARMNATNPLRVACARLNITMTQLSRASGVPLDTLKSIIAGNSLGSEQTWASLAPFLEVPATTMAERMRDWQGRFPSRDLLTPKARAVCDMPPAEVFERFASFTEWEAFVAGSTRRLAQLLHCMPNKLTAWKTGQAVNFPQAVYEGLLNDLRLSPEYIGELAALPRVGRVAPEARARAAAGESITGAFS